MRNGLCIFWMGWVLMGCGPMEAVRLPEVREGDVIFQSTPSRQTRALEVATGSVYTHVGLVLREGGQKI